MLLCACELLLLLLLPLLELLEPPLLLELLDVLLVLVHCGTVLTMFPVFAST
ncbi:MAG: hypothetical protein FWG42_11965 [Clostridiales bacterium]|nr:hypothetical protein [Clostridiales bacterium]